MIRYLWHHLRRFFLPSAQLKNVFLFWGAVLLLINALNWLLAHYIVGRIIVSGQDLALLHYNVNFGVNLIGPIREMYTLPFIGLMVTVVNYFIVVALDRWQDAKFVTHLLMACAVVVNFVLLGGLFSLYLINFY
ncbi:hypothetical protein D6821_01675 [Candidatus Parcubacteria bacterium]|nr:MAG: hypothetical protein D6821_01675 [Candidatus Parcubacteria bacterium]